MSVLARLAAAQLGEWLERHQLYLLHRIHGASIGDLVTATAFMRAVHRQTGRRFVVVSKYPEIFAGNPLVVRNIGTRTLNWISKPIVKAVLRAARHTAIGEHGYKAPGNSAEAIAEDHRRKISEAEFCAETLMRQWGVSVDFSNISPELYFAESELATLAGKFRLPPVYAIIKPQGGVGYTRNREWFIDRYQQLVNKTPWITWVHPGVPDEPGLDGVIDLRGQANIRELFYLIRGARFVLSGEGLLNHVAAAFDVPSYVIFSGFCNVELANYNNTIPIVRTPQVSCAPCWKLTPCPVPGMPCMSDISVEQVLTGLEREKAALAV